MTPLSQLSSYATAKTHSIVTPTRVISDGGEHGTQSSVALLSQSLLMLIKEREKKKKKEKKRLLLFFYKKL
jgi:hypothetical protein